MPANILPINVVGITDVATTSGLPTTIFSKAAIKDVFIINQDPLPVAITGSLIMDDNAILDVGYVEFNLVNGIAPAEGRLVWSSEDGTLDFGLPGGNVNLQIGQEMVVRVRNNSGSTIVNGTPVNIVGAQGNSPTIGLADASDPTTGSFGLTTEDIDNNSFGYVTTFGLVRGDEAQPINTASYSPGDRLFVSDTPGLLTDVYPVGTSSRIIFMAIVLVSNTNNGVLWVTPINTPFLSELSGNSLLTAENRDLIQYDGASGLWANTSDLTISGTTVNFANLPTSSGSLNPGDLWIDPSADYTLKVTPG